MEGSPPNLMTVVSDVLFFHTTLSYSQNVGSKKSSRWTWKVFAVTHFLGNYQNQNRVVDV